RVPEEGETEIFADPSQCLIVDSSDGIVGQLARLLPDITKQFGIKQEVFFIDLDFDMIADMKSVDKNFSSLPIFPAVKRDIALLVPISVRAGDLLETVRKSKEKFIEHCEIFDIYQGKPLEDGMKSVAISVTYRSPTKTLTEKNVNKSHTKIINTLTSKYNGSLREG
ncbi:MAG: phenylalanine--tRNA ligase subunit beta, partial [Desulfocapsa sp.]|nr:phenylalanine--tRNA ligase subunit beta [Desulfocapsa sp.]